MGISNATFYQWRHKYSGLVPWEMRRLCQIEVENNNKRKRSVADLSLDKAMVQVNRPGAGTGSVKGIAL